MISPPFCQEHPAVQTERLVVAENVPLGQETFRIRLLDSKIAASVRPGQFVMLRLPDRSDPLLGRPLAVFQTSPEGAVDLVYLVVGKMTSRLAAVRAGDSLEMWGPLGNFFRFEDADRLIMVAGGIGQTPMLMLSKAFLKERGVGTAALLYGARNKARFSCLEDFERAGVNLYLASDDGSAGHQGPVTDLIPEIARTFRKENGTSRIKIVACGPQPMLRSVFAAARKLELPCEVSLESPMACGLGICFSCVVPYRETETADSWEYVRTCVNGPIFDAYRLKWD